MELGSVYIMIPLHQQRARHRADNHGGRQDSHYTEKLILQWTFSEHFNLKVNLLHLWFNWLRRQGNKAGPLSVW